MRASRDAGRDGLLVRVLFIAECGRPRAVLGRELNAGHVCDNGRKQEW